MTTTAVAALDRLLEVTVLLGRDMAEALATQGLTVPRVTLLWHVRQHGPSTQRSLADGLGVTPRNVTGLVDGLVEAGLVTREPHPTDRRATLVSFTDRGSRLVDELGAGQAELAEQLFGGLGAQRLADLVTGLDEVLGRLRALVAEAAS